MPVADQPGGEQRGGGGEHDAPGHRGLLLAAEGPVGAAATVRWCSSTARRPLLRHPGPQRATAWRRYARASLDQDERGIAGTVVDDDP